MEEKLKSMDEIRKMAEEEQKAQETTAENENLPQVNEQHNGLQVIDAVDTIKSDIVSKATEKVNNKKSIDKHSSALAKVGDESIKADIEEQSLRVERKKADNKVEKQEIKNRLLELATEKKRLKAEQKQILKEQKADHKKRNKDAKWAIYGYKLKKIGYDYVPNPFILGMLLLFDGIVSFFNGVGAVSTAILKCLKWFIIIGLILAVIMFIPATRNWLLTILQFK